MRRTVYLPLALTLALLCASAQTSFAADPKPRWALLKLLNNHAAHQYHLAMAGYLRDDSIAQAKSRVHKETWSWSKDDKCLLLMNSKIKKQSFDFKQAKTVNEWGQAGTIMFDCKLKTKCARSKFSTTSELTSLQIKGIESELRRRLLIELGKRVIKRCRPAN